MELVKRKLEQLEAGFITVAEFYKTLDHCYIRGALRDVLCNHYGFIGYNYLAQDWIDIKAS